MERSKPIPLKYTKDNFLVLLAYGENPEESPYTHKQIVEWCEAFCSKYRDMDTPKEIENIMPILADVEAQWDLYVANTYSPKELRELNFESVMLPVEWFSNWASKANT